MPVLTTALLTIVMLGDCTVQAAAELRDTLPEGVLSVADVPFMDVRGAWKMRGLEFNALLGGRPMMEVCARDRVPPTAVINSILSKGSVKFGLGTKKGRLVGAKEYLGSLAMCGGGASGGASGGYDGGHGGHVLAGGSCSGVKQLRSSEIDEGEPEMAPAMAPAMISAAAATNPSPPSPPWRPSLLLGPPPSSPARPLCSTVPMVAASMLARLRSDIEAHVVSRRGVAMPFVTLSYAQALDGSMAGPLGASGPRLLLSGRESMTLTHGLRAVHEAIMVGSGT